MEYDQRTQESVERMAQLGCTVQEIAYALGVPVDDLTDEAGSLRPLVLRGMARMRREIRRLQYQVAMSGNVEMLKWLGKNHLGQGDRLVIDDPLRAAGATEEAIVLTWEVTDGPYAGALPEHDDDDDEMQEPQDNERASNEHE